MENMCCPGAFAPLVEKFLGKRILILGFGREGSSSFRFLRGVVPEADLSVADSNIALSETLSELIPKEKIILGPDYLQSISQFDVVLQSPGISLKDVPRIPEKLWLTSQTDLFLRMFRDQCIGVTGTKGKSTTASLVHHLLLETGHDTLFGGNIGLPLLDLVPQVGKETIVVLELSCHQLEFVRYSPHVAVLLNLFEEHLDHYRDFIAYQRAKYNIVRFQREGDWFVCPDSDSRVEALMEEFPPKSSLCRFGKRFPSCLENFPLKGEHNRRNAEAALLAVKAAVPDFPIGSCGGILQRFHSLPHRLEYVGRVDGIDFYNDSISTIPQAAIAAVEAIGHVDTLILGGMDRGVDYTPLLSLMRGSQVRNFLFTGQAGRRMMSMTEPVPGKIFLFFEKYEELVDAAFRLTARGKVCLLSPAAPSYDAFKNFEERGSVFKKLVLLHSQT